jgi:predicted MFS family arabinose efflux permease
VTDSELENSLSQNRQIAGIELPLFAGVIASEVPRMFLIGIAPLFLSSFVDDRGFGEGRAAWLSSGELLASALAAIAVAGWLTRRSRTATAVFGLGLVVVAQLLSMLQFEFAPFLALRALAGLGAGLAGAASTAAAAGTENPERVVAGASFVTALLGAITIGPIGMAIGAYGAAGGFAIAAIVSLLVLPFLRGLPAPRATLATNSSERRGQHTLAATAILAAVFAFMLGQNAVWGFTARIGQSAGLSVEEISWVLAVTAAAGLAGAATAAILGTSRGRTLPILGAIGGTVIAVFMLVESTSTLAFIASNAAWTFLFAFSMPYFIGSLAALDRSGRWAAMGTGVAGIGAALGPAAVGGIVETNGYESLGFLMLAMGLLAALLIAPVSLQLDRRSARAESTIETDPTND